MLLLVVVVVVMPGSCHANVSAPVVPVLIKPAEFSHIFVDHEGVDAPAFKQGDRDTWRAEPDARVGVPASPQRLGLILFPKGHVQVDAQGGQPAVQRHVAFDPGRDVPLALVRVPACALPGGGGAVRAGQ